MWIRTEIRKAAYESDDDDEMDIDGGVYKTRTGRLIRKATRPSPVRVSPLTSQIPT